MRARARPVDGNLWGFKPLHATGREIGNNKRDSVLVFFIVYTTRHKNDLVLYTSNYMKSVSLLARLSRYYFLSFGIIFVTSFNVIFAQTEEATQVKHSYFDTLANIGWLLGTTTIIFLIYWWDRHSKDEEGKGFVAQDYEVPDNLTPIEVSAIVYQKVTYTSIFAELVYLATKGYIQIKQIDVPLEMYPEKIVTYSKGEFMGKDFALTLCKPPSTLTNLFDRVLLERIFDFGITDGGVRIVYLSRISDSFYYDAERIGVMACEGLLLKGYYKYLGKLRKTTLLGILPSHLIVPISTYVSYVVLYVALIDESFRVFYFLFGVVATVLVFVYISPAKTQKGMYAKESLLGLKQYMNVIEKDRIYFHNAPYKRPEQFEELLPFAMVLGVDRAWVREFEGIYTKPNALNSIDLVSLASWLSTPSPR